MSDIGRALGKHPGSIFSFLATAGEYRSIKSGEPHIDRPRLSE